jgi:hypothetical protein
MTYKTRKELSEVPRQELNLYDQVMQEQLQKYPDMTLEEATELLEMIPQ